ncbi:NUDIX domain-containing protein [Microlunatus elymi]|uniref:NUDIX domain-containing protein n=1 Tax=Microlunatus elymi TaxID=2596828 RepID=A0A516Q4Z8_9ACTN|nr:NUDIX domain-containing protein [Microlunatus elymi]
MKDRFRVVPAAYLILRRDDHVLLQQRSNTGYRDGYWAAGAAGHVEQGESVWRAACREAFEELGVEVEESNLEPLTTLHRTSRDADRRHSDLDERVDFFFTTQHWKGKPRTMEPEKSSGLDWFALDELPEPVVPHELQVLMALRAEFHGSGEIPAIMTHGW